MKVLTLLLILGCTEQVEQKTYTHGLVICRNADKEWRYEVPIEEMHDISTKVAKEGCDKGPEKYLK